VLFDEDDHSPITEAVWNVLSQCFQKVTPEFEAIRDERNQNEILFFVGQILTRKTKEEDIRSGAMDRQKLSAFTHYFFNKQYMTQFSVEGSTQEDAMQGKLMYTGLVIRQMIMCRLGIIGVSDRDSYKYKRINTPGVQYAKEFKTVLSTYLVKPVMSRIADAIDQPGFDYESLDVKGIVEKSINK
jgi:DNA-directed RNA polymerase beta subunit